MDNLPPIKREDGPPSQEETAESVPKGLFARWLYHRRRRRQEEWGSLDEAVSVSEVKALIHYVAERGIDSGGKISGPLYQAVGEFERATTQQERITKQVQIIEGYSKLTKLTFRPNREVNGRTVESTRHAFRHLLSIISAGTVFLIFAVATDMIGNWLAGLENLGDEPEWMTVLFDVHRIGLVYAAPFAWGGLGACVYLLKTMSDKAKDSTFDVRKIQGVGSRIFLGAIFGAVVVHLFYDFALTTGLSAGFNENVFLPPSTVAFLSGLGVKAVYAAFEKAVNTIHDRIQALGTAPPQG